MNELEMTYTQKLAMEMLKYSAFSHMTRHLSAIQIQKQLQVFFTEFDLDEAMIALAKNFAGDEL